MYVLKMFRHKNYQTMARLVLEYTPTSWETYMCTMTIIKLLEAVERCAVRLVFGNYNTISSLGGPNQVIVELSYLFLIELKYTCTSKCMSSLVERAKVLHRCAQSGGATPKQPYAPARHRCQPCQLR